ncbi:MAG: glycosyltransferase [Lentisphaeria bacterium]|nr:glycosyltransferase [Lentisphaeria bacterium]
MSEVPFPFLCSICIPTFNRAEYLRETLSRITAARSFQEKKIEIIISDNASTDHTESVCRDFERNYPDRIRYFRLKDAIDPHFNFQNALNHGSGKFLKLNTDYIAFAKGQMDKFMELLERFQDEADLIMPACCPKRKEEFVRIKTSDALLRHVSFRITSINMFCIKSQTYRSLDNPFRAWKTFFPHVDIWFRLLDDGKNAVILNHIGLLVQRIVYRKERNQAELFAHHYTALLHTFVKRGKIQEKTFQQEKMLVLFQYIIPFHFDFFHQYNESLKPLPFWKHTKYYRRDWFFYAALVWIAFYWFISNVIPIHQLLGKIKRHLRKPKPF